MSHSEELQQQLRDASLRKNTAENLNIYNATRDSAATALKLCLRSAQLAQSQQSAET